MQNGKYCVLQLLLASWRDAFLFANVVALRGAVAILAAHIHHHACAADGAVAQTGEQEFHPRFVGAAAFFVFLSDGAGLFPGRLVDDRGHAAGNTDLVLDGVGFAGAFAADALRGKAVVDVGAGVFFIAEDIIQGVLFEIVALGGFHALVVQVAQDGGVTHAGVVHAEDLPDDGCGLLVDFIVAVLVDLVAEGHVAAQVLAVLGHTVFCHAHALGNGLPLVLGKGGQDIQHQASGRGAGVDVFGNGDQADAGGHENILDGFQGIPQGAGKAIQPPDDDGFHFPAAAFLQQALNVRTVEVFPGKAFVGVDFEVRIAFDHRVGLKDFLLRIDADAVHGLLLGGNPDVSSGNGHGEPSFKKRTKIKRVYT